MNTELIDRSETNKEIRIEIAPDEVRKAYDSVSKRYAGRVQVPGFRKGLAPIDVVRMRFAEEIKSDVIQQILPDRVTEAIEEHGLRPLTEPHLHLQDAENVKVNGSQPIVVSVHVQVMPQIPEPDYEGLEATRRVRKVVDEEIDGIIDERRQQQSTFVPVEGRKSKDGDMVIVDLTGTFEDDPEADPIEVNDLEVQLGDEVIEKSFTENLIGLNPDDEKEFTVEYPEQFSSPALAGRKVNYKAKVKSIGTVDVPALDDEWVASLDEEVKTVKALKDRLRDQLGKINEGDADARVRSELIAKLIERHEFEVPGALIDSQARSLLDNFAQDLAQKGVDLEKVDKSFIEMTYHQMRGQAERDVRGAMLLEKIADLEKVNVTKEDIDSEIETMAAYYQVPVDEIRRSIDSQGGTGVVENNLRTRKAVESIVGKAKITEGEWKDETSGAQEEKPSPKKSKSEKEKKKPAKRKASKKESKEK